MTILPRILPDTRVISFLDERVQSPVEWLPTYLKLSGQLPPRRTSGSDTAREFQKSFLDAMADRFVQGSDVVVCETVAKKDVINGKVAQKGLASIRVLQPLNTPYRVLMEIGKSGVIFGNEGYDGVISSKRDTISSVQPQPEPIPNHSSRNNIVFVGTGNNEADYQSIMWFDHKLLKYLKEGIPGIKVDVIGNNWYVISLFFVFIRDFKDSSLYNYILGIE